MNFRKFDESQKSTFKYWAWHWFAFNYVSWKLGVWHPKWLLHDIEKPWLKLIWGDYLRVRNWHKYHNSHHIFYGRLHGYNKINWLAAVIDWECSRYTKDVCKRTAREEVDYLVNNDVNTKYSEYERKLVRNNCYPILDALGL